MKFSWKVFLSTILLVTLAFGTGGTVMISSLFRQTLEQEQQMALQENRYLCFSFQNTVQSMGSYQTFDPQTVLEQMENLTGTRNSEFSITENVKKIRFEDGEAFAESIPDGQRSSRVVSDETGNRYYQVVSHVHLSSGDYYLESYTNISSAFDIRRKYVTLYQGVLLAVTGISSLLLLIITHFLTRPLKRLTDTTRRIASGDFSTRAVNQSQDEIGVLTRNFNVMADVVEEKIRDLENTARQREDFVASFAHELKTPLTSIIGYADMLRTFDMDPEKRRTAANYIFKEGKRLEALSLHLLDLIVLHKENFELEPVACDAFLQDVENQMKPVLQKYQMTLETQSEKGWILVEPALMKTLLYNLIDNGCKASETESSLILSCKRVQEGFCLSVRDHGRGIPEEELSKITEPFYMVDKSRSRQQNGAGLGLALCQEIAQIHNSTLHFESKLGEGTCVFLVVKEAAGHET